MSSHTIFSICESKRDVYPNAKNYESHAIRLARSIRKNGGKHKSINIKMWYGEDAPPTPETTRILMDMGCDVVPGKCMYKKYPLYNKIEACNMRFDTDYAMWMDSDLYVLGDLEGLLNSDKEVLVSPDQNSFHRWSSSDQDPLWEKIYKELNVERPLKKIPCHIDSSVGNFYFCSGVFQFKIGVGFPEMYQECAATILGMGGPFTENFTQTGLGMAVHKGGYDYGLIPEKYHYFYALHDKKLAADTQIVHYQDNRVTEIKDEDWNVT
jgi:hypothetical protein